MVYVGVDLRQRFCYMTVLDVNGRILEQRSVPNQAEALVEYVEHWLRPIELAVEASGSTAALVDIVQSRVDRVVVVHPQRVKAIASAKLKNDRVDSETLAQLPRRSAATGLGERSSDACELRSRTSSRSRPELGNQWLPSGNSRYPPAHAA